MQLRLERKEESARAADACLASSPCAANADPAPASPALGFTIARRQPVDAFAPTPCRAPPFFRKSARRLRPPVSPSPHPTRRRQQCCAEAPEPLPCPLGGQRRPASYRGAPMMVEAAMLDGAAMQQQHQPQPPPPQHNPEPQVGGRRADGKGGAACAGSAPKPPRAEAEIGTSPHPWQPGTLHAAAAPTAPSTPPPRPWAPC